MKRVVVTTTAVILAGMWLVPWPWIFGPMMKPSLRGEVPADELEFASQVAAILAVYPALLILIIIFVTASIIMHRRAAKTKMDGSAPLPRAASSQLSAAEGRERERRKRKAEAAGDLLLTLAFIDADKNRK